MAARGGMPAGLVASTLPETNGEADDQGGQTGRGGASGRKRRSRYQTDEKGRSRNLVMPDSLYDLLCLYARKTKVKVREKGREYVRSLTVSEAACKLLASSLPRLRIVEDDQPAAE